MLRVLADARGTWRHAVPAGHCADSTKCTASHLANLAQWPRVRGYAAPSNLMSSTRWCGLEAAGFPSSTSTAVSPPSPGRSTTLPKYE